MRAPLVLASASPRRSELLAHAGYDFEVSPTSVDETPVDGEDALSYCERMAREKATAGARGRQVGTVLGGDTVVVVDGLILGKPVDVQAAHSMLTRLSGRAHQVASAVALVDVEGAVEVSAVEVSDVTVDVLDEATLSAYLDGGEWRGKAGAYAIQGEAGAFAHLVGGELDTVIGLPLRLVSRLERRLAERLS